MGIADDRSERDDNDRGGRRGRGERAGSTDRADRNAREGRGGQRATGDRDPAMGDRDKDNDRDRHQSGEPHDIGVGEMPDHIRDLDHRSPRHSRHQSGEDHDYGVGNMPDHIADLSHQTNRSFTEKDVEQARRDYARSNSFQNALETMAGFIGLANAPAGMLANRAANAWGKRPQGPTESYAGYLGRTQAANASAGMMGTAASMGAGMFAGNAKVGDMVEVGMNAVSRGMAAGPNHSASSSNPTRRGDSERNPPVTTVAANTIDQAKQSLQTTSAPTPTRFRVDLTGYQTS